MFINFDAITHIIIYAFAGKHVVADALWYGLDIGND